MPAAPPELHPPPRNTRVPEGETHPLPPDRTMMKAPFVKHLESLNESTGIVVKFDPGDVIVMEDIKPAPFDEYTACAFDQPPPKTEISPPVLFVEHPAPPRRT